MPQIRASDGCGRDAVLLARQGTHRFKEPTLRKIIGRRYPPLQRLGIVGNIQKD